MRASESLVVPEAGMSIQEVSSLLGLPAPTIRSWERRYGLPAPDRSTGGHRRFSLADVTQLRLMRDEVARGRRPVDAASWVAAEASAPLPHQGPVDALVAAAQRLDRSAYVGTLDAAAAEHGVATTTCDVVMPALRRIGAAWQAGRCDTAHEHLATEASLTWMHRLPDRDPVPSGADVVLLVCGPSDHHSLGLEGLAVLLRESGHDVRMLGARVPTSSLVAAIETVQPATVVVASHMTVARRDAVDSIAAADRLCPAVFYAGSAFSSRASRRRLPGTWLGEDFRHAAALVTSSLSDRQGV